ncbi:MAG: 3-phosphoshikimate 1-carboxyvinyltransferase [Acutalibacteraceae bacterium]
MIVTVKPGKANGILQAPPSKSYAHRMILCAALAKGTSHIRGVALSEDILATLDCIRALGVPFEQNGDTLTIHGGIRPSPNPVFPCRESGSTLRFFIPVSLLRSENAAFCGTERLIERGIHVYEDLFREHGITFQKADTQIQASGTLCGGTFTLPGNVSSQYISGLLFALPLLSTPSTIHVLPPVESRPYIDITLSVMRAFGVEVREIAQNTFFIPASQSYQCRDAAVEGDWSNAAFLLALQELSGSVCVTGLAENSMQGDKVCVSLFKQLGIPNSTVDIADCPDLAPILFALSAVKGETLFTGTKRLKIKECDRGQAMAQELQKFGVSSEVSENTVRIFGGKLQKPTEILCGHNDHRIVMAMTVLSSITGGQISDAQAVRKSYPNFFEDMTRLGLEVEYGN